MTKCKLCKTNIYEGTTYCEACLEKNSAKTNESYLDSLLNSVINTVPAAEAVYRKSNNGQEAKLSTKSENKIKSEHDTDYDDMLSFDVDLEDLDDFDEFDINHDLEDSIVIDDEVLFGVALKEETQVSSENEQDHLDATIEDEDDLVGDNNSTHEIVNYDTSDEYDSSLNDLLDQLALSDIHDELPQTENDTAATIRINESSPSEVQSQAEEARLTGEQSPIEAFGITGGNNQAVVTSSINVHNPKEEYDHMEQLYQEFSHMEQPGQEDIQMEQPDLDSIQMQQPSQEVVTQTKELNQDNETDDDLLDLLNQISSEDPVSDDIQAISELLSGRVPAPNQENSNVPSDVGEVFSDALKVVSSLDDPDIDDFSSLDLLEATPKEKEKKKKTKKVKIKKEKNKKSKKTAQEEEPLTPKKGLVERFFGNVEESDSKKKASIAKEEQAATKEKTKKNKKRKDKKAAPVEEKPGEGLTDSPKQTKASKAEAKKEKKEKKKKDKEIMQVIDEVDEDEGRINRVGASIVFVFFGILVTVLLIGTNIFSYSLSIHNASDYFERHKYTQAYNEVYGIDIKDEDIELYDKIQTVMFVNKQLNSYNNYYLIGKFPEALDSLLKGLSRYDKYIELATMLGIDSDLDYVRDQIIAELNRVYRITEEEALMIINSDTKAQYSVRVYDVVLEKMSN